MIKAFIADFGAGNTCLYTVVPGATEHDPQPLNNSNGEPSGYALDKNGNVMLGMNLLGISYEDLKEIETFRINLKAKPTAQNAKEMIFYFSSWLKRMKEERAGEFADVGPNEAYWFIGFPTGDEWKAKETRELYKDIFEKAGFEHVTLVPESNAAMAYYQKTRGVLSGYSKQKMSLLLLDQGAYSLDATFYGDELISKGSYLGASLIEHMMVRTILYENEEDNRQDQSIHNMPDVLAEARDLYEAEDGSFKTYLLLHGRGLKEDYFTQERNHTLSKHWDVVRSAKFRSRKGNPLSLFVNEKMMRKILFEKPIRQILGKEFADLAPEVQEELGNKTWIQALNSFLDKLPQCFPQIKNQSGQLRVMLTGGGSRMKCVEEAVKEKYGLKFVYDDPKAISAIGMGMAYWAPDKINADHFEEVFLNFLQEKIKDDDGDDVNVILKVVAEQIYACINEMIGGFVTEEGNALTYGIVDQWLEYKCSSSNIPDKIEWHFNDWSKNTGKPNFIKAIGKCVNDLKSTLNRRFIEVLRKNGMQEEILLEENDQVFLSVTQEILQEIFDLVIRIVVDHYKESKVLKDFTNKGKGLFSNPRSQYLNQNSDAIKNWIERELESTVDGYKKVFLEIVVIEEEQKAFFQIFVEEAFYDLCKLMEEHKKKILGKLVLEEYLED